MYQEQINSVVRGLIKALKDDHPQVKKEASDALCKRGNEAIPAIIEALQCADPDTRQLASVLLLRLELDLSNEIPALLQALDDKDWKVRRGAVIALGLIGLPNKDCNNSRTMDYNDYDDY
jgi:HEAT repeat protein